MEALSGECKTSVIAGDVVHGSLTLLAIAVLHWMCTNWNTCVNNTCMETLIDYGSTGADSYVNELGASITRSA